MAYDKAVYIVNKYIEADNYLRAVFSPGTINLFPGVAGEPIPPNTSYPYIRYLDVPIIDARNTNIRRDFVQYFVGAKDLVQLAKIIERLIYILNYDTNQITRPVVDTSGRYKIFDLEVSGGSRPDIPSQDEGVWEQSVNCRMSYTIISQSWIAEPHVQHKVSSIITI
jgi:hypothetical protein